MKSVKGYQYVLSAFLLPLGPFTFLLLLNVVAWGSFSIVNRLAANAQTAALVSFGLTSLTAVLLLTGLIVVPLRNSGKALRAAYWFPLVGIVVYYVATAVLWRTIYGIRETNLIILMGPVTVTEGVRPLNVIGFDIGALVITLLFGVLVVSGWAIVNGRKSQEM